MLTAEAKPSRNHRPSLVPRPHNLTGRNDDVSLNVNSGDSPRGIAELKKSWFPDTQH